MNEGPTTERSASRLLVLVLDDDLTVARMVAKVVEFLGHEPLVETNSMDALNKHARAGLAAAVVDYMMPSVDGIEVLAQLQEVSPKTRRVLLTAAPRERMVQDALTAGIVHTVVPKPYLLEDIQLALAWLVAP